MLLYLNIVYIIDGVRYLLGQKITISKLVLSALYSMNDFQIIKTNTCNEDKTLLREYIKRYCCYEHIINCIMSGENFNSILGQIIYKKKHRIG